MPVLNLGGCSATTSAGARAGELTLCFGRRALLGYVATPGGGTWWFAQPPAPREPTTAQLAATPDHRWRSWLEELYRTDRLPVRELVEAIDGRIRAWKAYDLASVPRWHDGATVLIGDAVHVMSPATGQGASLAAEDAVILAHCLRDLPVSAALTRFEQVRRPRVEQIVARGADSSRPAPPNVVSRTARDLLMPLALRRAAARGRPPTAWIHRHHIIWDAHASTDVPVVDPATAP